MTVAPVIPQHVTEKVRDFLEAQKTGKVELDIKDGRILGCRLIESVRIKRHT